MCEHGFIWECSQPVTYGGPAGNYNIKSPWNGPAEMMVMGAFVQTPGAAFISPSMGMASDSSSIATNANAGVTGTPGIYINAAGNGQVPFAPVWFPMQGAMTLQVTGVTLVTIVYRRKRPIPAQNELGNAVKPHQS